MTIIVIYVLLALGGLTIFLRRNKSRVPLPPSPPSDFILGHLRHIPAENPQFKYTEWAREYGDVIYLKILNRPVVVLNSAEAAMDLLEKRSKKYSDRPPFHIYNLMGWNDSMTFLPYGKQFQKQRQLYQEYLGRTKVEGYINLQVAHARRLALSLAQGVEEREYVLEKYGTAIIVRVAFGHDMFLESDPRFDEMIRANSHAMVSCGPPGGTPVDLFPILKHFPSWFPGTHYANKARESQSIVRSIYDYPFEKARRQLLDGVALPSFLAYHIQDTTKSVTAEEINDIKGTAATMFAAGATTMWSTLSIFILAMVLHPECQEQAQSELDAHIPRSRLPNIEDRPSLPYIDFIIQETYRWIPAVPLGVPRCTTEDDVYKGMFIPRGTTIFANAWGMSRDERRYCDASSFNPSRYKAVNEGGNGEPFPPFPFGYGRRICPGRNLADTNLWIAIATILALFRIRKTRDENGKENEPEVNIKTGLTSHPTPYSCHIHVRDHEAQMLLNTMKEELNIKTTGEAHVAI